MIEAKPENLIGDRAYDSDPLDAELRKDGIEMIAPHRSNRSKPPTQDRRRLSRYMRRRLIEARSALRQCKVVRHASARDPIPGPLRSEVVSRIFRTFNLA